MQLKTGPSNIRKNMTALMGPVKSASRKKAIMTIAKRRNIGRSDAQFTNAKAIALRLARKK